MRLGRVVHGVSAFHHWCGYLIEEVHVLLLALERTDGVPRVLAVQVGLASADDAPAELARGEARFVLDVYLLLLLLLCYTGGAAVLG